MSAAPVVTACTSRAGRPKTGYRWGRRLAHALHVTERESGRPARWYRCADCGWLHVSTQEDWR